MTGIYNSPDWSAKAELIPYHNNQWNNRNRANMMFKLKGITIAIILCSWLKNADAQFSESDVISHYVFKEFTLGSVTFKTGAPENVMLNYNSLTQEMVFVKSGEYLAIAQIQNIDTITISNRKFIPVDSVFYELAVNGPVPLFINHKCRIIQAGKPAGYGATSQASNISTATGVLDRKAYQLKLPDDYALLAQTEFFFRKKGEFLKITNMKQVIKMFPEKSDIIGDYIKDNKIRPGNQEDMVKLIRFCNSKA